jgi:dTMP kinase
MARGKLIVFEGIDGSGMETQTNRLVSYLRKKGKKAVRLHYPEGNKPLGRFIYNFLNRKYDLSPQTQFLLFATDMLKDLGQIKKLLKAGTWVVIDRYLTSTITYQSVAGFPADKGKGFVKLFGVPRFDRVVYLDISPATSMKRKRKEKKYSLDRHESNRKFLAACRARYRKHAKERLLGPWSFIDGEQARQEVFDDIKKALGI